MQGIRRPGCAEWPACSLWLLPAWLQRWTSALGIRYQAIQNDSPRRNSDALPAAWYDGPNAAANAIDYAKHRSRSADAMIRVYDAARNVIETHEHKWEFKELW